VIVAEVSSVVTALDVWTATTVWRHFARAPASSIRVELTAFQRTYRAYDIALASSWLHGGPRR